LQVWIRWLLVLPAAYLAWGVALLFGMLLHGAAQSLCPDDQMVSGMCTAPWSPQVDRIVTCLGAGTAAALILISSTLMAPSHRLTVAWVTLGIGVFSATGFALLIGAWLELISAITAGVLALWWLRRQTWMHREL
jgi:hypothetical protein